MFNSFLRSKVLPFLFPSKRHSVEKPIKLSDRGVSVLAVISSSKEHLTGYEVSKAINVSSGAIYPVLARLLLLGCIKARIEKLPNRKITRYSMTNKGKHCLEANIPKTLEKTRSQSRRKVTIAKI